MYEGHFNGNAEEECFISITRVNLLPTIISFDALQTFEARIFLQLGNRTSLRDRKRLSKNRESAIRKFTVNALRTLH